MNHFHTVGIDIRLLGRQRTGDETVFFNLTRALIRRRDPDIRYRLFTDEHHSDRLAILHLRLELLNRDDVEIISLPGKNRFLWNAVALPWGLRQYPVDVYHTQYILPFVVPRRTALVTHIHDVSFLAHPEWISVSDRFFLSLLIPRTVKLSQSIIVPSNFTKTELERYFPGASQKVVIIPNAAAEEWCIHPTPEMIERVLKRFHLSSQGYLLSYGTMQPRKNIAFLEVAYAEAKRAYGLSMELVLTGDPFGRNVDRKVLPINSESGVQCTGYLADEELRALVFASRGVVFPSLYEGFGLPIEEARSLGVPVLASDIPVFHEVGGDAISYLDVSSLDRAAQSLYTFSVGQTSPLGVAKSSYSWEKSAKSMVQVYRTLFSAL